MQITIDLNLTPRELGILKHRLIQPHTLEETGQEFGITRERVRQIQYEAFTKLITAIDNIT